MKKKYLSVLAMLISLSMVMSISTLALDDIVEEGTRVTLSKDNLLSDGGFEKAAVGTEKSISWMMPIAGKFEVIEDSSLAIEGSKLIKAKSAQDVRIAIPEVKAGYKIQISFYYKNVDSNGLWSLIKDIDNTKSFTELTGANAFTNEDFKNGWHHVTERISVGKADVATLVPGEYHYAMGCFGEGGEIYFDAFELVVKDKKGNVIVPISDNDTVKVPLGKKIVKIKKGKKVTLKFAFKGSKKPTYKTSNKKVIKIIKKKAKSVTLTGLKKGKAKITVKSGKQKYIYTIKVLK